MPKKFDVTKSKFIRLILEEYIKKKEQRLKKEQDDIIQDVMNELSLIQLLSQIN